MDPIQEALQKKQAAIEQLKLRLAQITQLITEFDTYKKQLEYANKYRREIKIDYLDGNSKRKLSLEECDRKIQELEQKRIEQSNKIGYLNTEIQQIKDPGNPAYEERKRLYRF